MFLVAGSTGSIASCQELAYEFEVDGLGMVAFTFIVGDEWVLSKPFMIGYTLSIEGNGSVIGVLRLVFRCGDVVSSSEHLLGYLGGKERLSSFIAIRPTASLLHCEKDYLVLEPVLLLYKIGNGNSSSRQYSYRLSPVMVKLVKPLEAVRTGSCRVSIGNDTALELCVESVQPWTLDSTAKLLVSLRSTKALENVVVGVKAGEWVLASRIVDLTATSTRAWFFVEQKVVAALWRENGTLTLTVYAKADRVSVKTPLEVVLEKPNVSLLVDVKPLELVAGVPNTVEVRITNAWTKAVVVRGVELVLNETKTWIEVGETLASLASLAVKHKVLVNKTGVSSLEVRVCYVAGVGVHGCIEKRVKVRIVSPLKMLSLEPSTVEANETVKVTVLSLIESNNATLIACPVNGGKPIVLAKGVYLGKTTPTILEAKARLEPGDYLVKIVDEHGYESNSLRLRVVKPKQAVEKESEFKIMIVPLQTSVMAGGVAEIQVAVSPPQKPAFKLYRLVEMPKQQWVLEHILEVVEESKGIYTVRYKAPDKPGAYMYKLVVVVDGVEKETRFTLEVKEKKRSLQLGPPQEATPPQQLLPDWTLPALIGVSIAGGLLLFRKYGRGA